MTQENIQKLNLEIYDYIDKEHTFKYDLKSQFAQAGSYLVTADLIKIVKLLQRINITYQIDSNKFIQIQ